MPIEIAAINNIYDEVGFFFLKEGACNLLAIREWSELKYPLLRSTVTPDQLPTFCLAPVSRLKIVVLPQFGLPANAIR